MKLTNKVKQQIIDHIRIFIPNYIEFFDQFNEQSILYGRYLVHHINDDNVNNNIIDIITNFANFRFLHHFLLANHFSIVKFNNMAIYELDLQSLKKLTTDIVVYEKHIGDYSLNINIVKTPNIYNYLGFNVKLKIEQSYYNGSLLVVPYKKMILSRYEENDRIKLNDSKLVRKLMYYVNNGYTFNITTDNGEFLFKSNNYKNYKYYSRLLKYYLSI